MHLVSLSISNFRNIAETTIEPDPLGTTVITGLNGAGKTSVLEAVAYLATLQSFRGSPREAMIRHGAQESILRTETRVGIRPMTIEAELSAAGRSRTMVNRQAVRRRGDLHDALRTTVFSPEDIGVVRAGPAERRRFLDEVLAVVDPKAARSVEATLDVWDARLDAAGSSLVAARETLVAHLAPITEVHYARLAGESTPVGLAYRRSWVGRLGDALVESRERDVARGVSLVGPHRDELDLSLRGLPGRTHASQGEQRSLALALRLAAHQLATERLGSAPVLLLDDVFSELDPLRSRALLAGLPAGQTLLTTALPAPPEIAVSKVYVVVAGAAVEPVGVREEP